MCSGGFPSVLTNSYKSIVNDVKAVAYPFSGVDETKLTRKEILAAKGTLRSMRYFNFLAIWYPIGMYALGMFALTSVFHFIAGLVAMAAFTWFAMIVGLMPAGMAFSYEIMVYNE